MEKKGGATLARPERIISLVPSITETVCRFGMAKQLVGATDYCDRPAAALEKIARVGGPKDPVLKKILALKPDLVLASDEENEKDLVAKLLESGVEVRVARVRSVADAFKMMRFLAELSPEAERAHRQVTEMERACEEVRRISAGANIRTACFLWRTGDGGAKSYTTCSAGTYVSDLIALMGGVNIFADLPAQYPKIKPAQIEKRKPELILLPTEPYYFRRRDVRELTETLNCPAARNRNIRIVNGRLLVWYGSAILDGVKTLAPLFRR
jgi:ABC-type Fe3+-hydroxamate transport system substrate-binding protein